MTGEPVATTFCDVTRFLVRHAKAGQRSEWRDDDALRPLSKSGRRQADALADHLVNQVAGPLLSSPFLRCRQTLEPLARCIGLEVIDDERLSEGQPFEPALELLESTPDGSVLCVHGDLLPELIGALARRGAVLATAPDWRKAVVWELVDTDDPDGTRATRIGLLRALPPPS